MAPLKYCMCRAVCFSPDIYHMFIVGASLYLELVDRAVSRMSKSKF